MRLSRIDRYLLGEMVGPFFFGLFIFGSLWLANLLIRMVNLFVTKGVAASAVGQIFLYSTPAVIVTTLPMASLLATLLALGRMSSDSEIVALKSCGIGFERVLAPLAVAGVGMSLVACWFNESIVPEANRRREYVFINEVVLKKPLPKIAKDVFFDGGEEFKMFVRSYSPAEERMIDITMYQFKRDDYPSMTEAREARIQDEIWTFRDGRILMLDEKTGRLREEIFFDSWEYPIKSRHADRVDNVSTSEGGMSMRELWSRILAAHAQDQPTRRLWVEFWLKSSFPFANLFLLLLGAPLAVTNARSGASLGVGLSIVIMFAYYVVIAIGNALAQSAYLSPFIGAWLPNVLAGMLAFVLIRRANQA